MILHICSFKTHLDVIGTDVDVEYEKPLWWRSLSLPRSKSWSSTRSAVRPAADTRWRWSSCCSAVMRCSSGWCQRCCCVRRSENESSCSRSSSRSLLSECQSMYSWKQVEMFDFMFRILICLKVVNTDYFTDINQKTNAVLLWSTNTAFYDGYWLCLCLIIIN